MKKDHNMWKYIYYSIYLDTKDTSDHTALEKFVYEMVSAVDYKGQAILAVLSLISDR